MFLTKPWIHCLSAWTPCSRRLSLPLKRRACVRLALAKDCRIRELQLDKTSLTEPTPWQGYWYFPASWEKTKAFFLTSEESARRMVPTRRRVPSHAVLFLSGSLVVRTRTLPKSFARTPSLALYLGCPERECKTNNRVMNFRRSDRKFAILRKRK